MTAPTPNAELAPGWRPATDSLLADLADCVRKVREHEHPTRDEDIYCLNLTSYMGERMGAVLKRLDEERAAAQKLYGSGCRCDYQGVGTPEHTPGAFCPKPEERTEGGAS